MTPEPLKGKRQLYEDDFGGKLEHFDPIDVKSAVEGCLEEVLKLVDTSEDIKPKWIRKIFKKWFEDVMKNE